MRARSFFLSRSLLLITIGILIFGCIGEERPRLISEAEARKYIEQDLRTKFPEAEIREIISATTDGKSWLIKARVTYNFSSPCPVRIHVLYDFPRRGFEIWPPEYIIRGCRICITEPCIIGIPEEAIIASHTRPGAEDVRAYVTAHPDAKPTVKVYHEYFDPETNITLRDVWIVKWYSRATNYAILTAISYNGRIERVWKEIVEVV